MPRYRVRAGAQLTHGGQVHAAGAIVDLPVTTARDIAVAHAVEEVDAAGKPVAPTPVDDLEGYRAHERVGFLRERRAAAQQVVDDLDARLAAEQQQIVDAAKTMTTNTSATPAAALKE